MKRLGLEAIKEEALFREMRKATPYLKSEIDWSDLKKHRREMRLDFLGKIES